MAALEEHVAMVWVVALLLLPYVSEEEPLLGVEMGFSTGPAFSRRSLLKLPRVSYRGHSRW